jgi:cytochrome o ubiquinol oxidase subunit II
MPADRGKCDFNLSWGHESRTSGRCHRFNSGVRQGRIELVVRSVPALTIILLGGVAWIGAHQLDPARAVEGSAKPLTIQAV